MRLNGKKSASLLSGGKAVLVAQRVNQCITVPGRIEKQQKREVKIHKA